MTFRHLTVPCPRNKVNFCIFHFSRLVKVAELYLLQFWAVSAIERFFSLILIQFPLTEYYITQRKIRVSFNKAQGRMRKELRLRG